MPSCKIFDHNITSFKKLVFILMLLNTSFVHAGALGNYPEPPSPIFTDYNEEGRGQYHFSPKIGWMNDINAPLYYRGQYHIFFQHTPHSLMHHSPEMHWGHATSPDLMYWTQQNIALEPSVHNLGDLWSGAGWVDTDNVTNLKIGDHDPILLYTSTNGVAIAYSTDGGATFKTYNNGQKVVLTPGENSRDPKVQWDPVNQQWIMALWAEEHGSWINRIKFYRSTNLLTWNYTSEYVTVADKEEGFYECPDLFRLPIDGNQNNYKWILMDASGKYVIGDIDANGNFSSNWGLNYQRMEMGETGFYNRGIDPPSSKTDWYASLTFNQLPSDRVVQMAWQPGNEGEQWTGNATFPVELRLKQYPEGVRITRTPIEEISNLRYGTHSWGVQTLVPNSSILTGFADDTYEIKAVFDVSQTAATIFGFKLGSINSAGNNATTEITYNRSTQMLDGVSVEPINNKLKVQFLVDRSQLEIFANDGKTVISKNVNFELSKQYISFHSNGNVKLDSMEWHRINSTWGTQTAPKLGNAIYFDPSLYLPAPGPDALQRKKCVDRDVGSGRVQLWNCFNNPNQSWIMNLDGTIRNLDVCMEVPSSNLQNGSLVRVASCTGANNQRWTKNNMKQLVNMASGRCLDLAYGEQINGKQLQVWDCWNTKNLNQEWSGLDGSETGRIQWEFTNKCLQSNNSNNKAVIWDCDNDSDQQWHLKKNGNLSVSNMCLAQPSTNMSNGARLVMELCSDADHQKWSKIDNGYIMNHASRRCIDLDSGNPANGLQLQVWDCWWATYNKNQIWLGPL